MLYDIKRPLRIFEAFAGYGSQSLALERLHRNYPEFCYEIVGYSEIDSYAIKAYQALHGTDIPNFGDISQIDWSQVPDFDLFTYSSPCFPKGTLVLTDSGYKPIEDVSDKDKVLTHTNTFQRVIKPMCRRHHGMMFNITSSIFNDLTCTDNHPLYVRRMWRKGHEGTRTFDAPEWLNPKQMLSRIMSDEKPRTVRYYVGYAININSELPKWGGCINNMWGHHRHEDKLTPLFGNLSFWYIMGRWVGDGWKRESATGNSIIICCGGRYEKELIDAFDAVGWHYRKCTERTVLKFESL